MPTEKVQHLLVFSDNLQKLLTHSIGKKGHTYNILHLISTETPDALKEMRVEEEKKKKHKTSVG
jgi:hypothetical protein